MFDQKPRNHTNKCKTDPDIATPTNTIKPFSLSLMFSKGCPWLLAQLKTLNLAENSGQGHCHWCNYNVPHHHFEPSLIFAAVTTKGFYCCKFLEDTLQDDAHYRWYNTQKSILRNRLLICFPKPSWYHTIHRNIVSINGNIPGHHFQQSLILAVAIAKRWKFIHQNLLADTLQDDAKYWWYDTQKSILRNRLLICFGKPSWYLTIHRNIGSINGNIPGHHFEPTLIFAVVTTKGFYYYKFLDVTLQDDAHYWWYNTHKSILRNRLLRCFGKPSWYLTIHRNIVSINFNIPVHHFQPSLIFAVAIAKGSKF